MLISKILNKKPVLVARKCALSMPMTEGFVTSSFDNAAIIWQTMPDRLFKIEHLLLWGITRDTRIVYIHVGNINVLPINAEPVSALLYYTKLPVEMLNDVIREDKFLPSLSQVLDAPICDPWSRIQICIDGPVSDIAFVGQSLVEV
jgi:hypothetical protein